MKNEQGGPVAIEQLICVVRGKKVILDSDLARIYGVPTKRFNQQVKRNRDRFPGDCVPRTYTERGLSLSSMVLCKR